MTEEKMEEMRQMTQREIVESETAEAMYARRKREEQRKAAEKLRRAAETFGTGFLGFLLGGTALPMAGYPLGCALVTALPKNTVAALLGIMLRAVLLSGGGADLLLPVITVFALLAGRIVLNIIIFGQKNIIRLKRLPDSIGTKVLLGAFFVFGISFTDAVFRGFSLQGMLTAVLFTLACVSFILLFTFFFDEEYRSSPVFEAGLGAVVFTAALSLMPFSFVGFSLGEMAAFGITFYIGFLGVPTRSASVGLLCGLACGGFFAPVLALAGLVVGIFADTYAALGTLFASLVTVCSALYFGTWEGVLSFLPELAVSASLVTALVMLELLPREMFPEYSFSPAKENTAAILLNRRAHTERETRMRGLSGALESLSGMIQNLSDRFRRPRPEKLTEKSLEIWKSYCEKCPNECSCRGLASLESEKLVSKLASRLMETGKIDREKLYEITRVRCPHLDAVAEEISALSAKLLEDAIREDKTHIFALDYEVMSQMFADAAAEGDMRLPIDKVLSDRLRRAFFRAGLRAENIIVCGDRKKVVIATGEEVARTELRPSDIRMICENICAMRFAKPSFMLEAGKSAFVLESLPVYEMESVLKQLPKQGEIVCGDSVSVSVSHDDYFYAFLCDGMGSGEEAALTSKLCRIFLEKMLVCGNRKSTTLAMLNHLLCSRNTECFATVDLCEIDLVLGVASFLKSGAVPSFVMRAGKLYKIASGTFPIGILPQVSADVTDFELCAGDVILMCSDGIVSDPDAADGEDSIRFLELVTREWTDDLEKMAEKILRYSSEFSLGADDMTVALLRIKRA